MRHTSMLAASQTYGYDDSGAQAMHSMTCSCSRSSALHSPVATTQTRTVWSLEELARSDPSPLTRTMRTHSLWPVNVFTQYLQPQHTDAKELMRRLETALYQTLWSAYVRWKNHTVTAAFAFRILLNSNSQNYRQIEINEFHNLLYPEMKNYFTWLLLFQQKGQFLWKSRIKVNAEASNTAVISFHTWISHKS